MAFRDQFDGFADVGIDDEPEEPKPQRPWPRSTGHPARA